MNPRLRGVALLLWAVGCQRSTTTGDREEAPLERKVHTTSSSNATTSREPAASRPKMAPSPLPEHRALGAALTHAFPGFELKLTHRPAPHQVRGSGHTHCAPDHSAVDPAEQQRRLVALGPDHRHHFVWMTAHNFVAPDPRVDGVLHMFGVEIYTKRLPGESSPHMVALLPDAKLAGVEARPFGVYEFDVPHAARAIAAAGGLSVLAHPSRYSPSTDALLTAGPELWAIEVLSGSTRPEDNARFVDDRLSAGKFTCLSAGGDIHGEDYKLTSGYQVVEADRPELDRQDLFAAIAACNFFACGVRSEKHGPIRAPRFEAREGALHFSSKTVLRSVRFVGKGGRVLHEAKGTTRARYTPKREDGYVRVEAVSVDGNARCYSQPAWIEDRSGKSDAVQRAHPASESRGSKTKRKAP